MADHKDLTEHFIAGELVFDGALLKVRRDRVRLPDATEGAREYIRHPGAVAVVALFDDGSVLLERQFRYPHRREFIEIPAGKLEAGEAHLATAKRELAEETGLTGGEWHEVSAFWTTPGFTRERMTLFFAEGVEPGEARPEEDESFELVRWPVAEIESRLGEIKDAKSLVGLLLYLRDCPAVGDSP